MYRVRLFPLFKNISVTTLHVVDTEQPATPDPSLAPTPICLPTVAPVLAGG